MAVHSDIRTISHSWDSGIGLGDTALLDRFTAGGFGRTDDSTMEKKKKKEMDLPTDGLVDKRGAMEGAVLK